MSGVKVAMVGYVCRVCGEPTRVGIAPREVDGDLVVCPVNQRLYQTNCESCGEERTHVIDAPGADAATDEVPIEGLVR